MHHQLLDITVVSWLHFNRGARGASPTTKWSFTLDFPVQSFVEWCWAQISTMHAQRMGREQKAVSSLTLVSILAGFRPGREGPPGKAPGTFDTGTNPVEHVCGDCHRKEAQKESGKVDLFRPSVTRCAEKDGGWHPSQRLQGYMRTLRNLQLECSKLLLHAFLRPVFSP